MAMSDATQAVRSASLPAFLSKEWRELFRQARVFIILAPLFFFAILNPVMIKLLPRILGPQLGQLAQVIQVSAADAIQGYFKNVGDISLFVFVLALMGTVAEERAAGVYHILFSRHVRRWQSVAAKYLVNLAVVTAGLIGSALLARYYVGVLFAASLPAADFIVAALIDAAYYAFVLGMLLLFSAVVKRGFTAGIATLVLTMMLPLLGYIPELGHYLPHSLLGSAISIAVAGTAPPATAGAVAVALFLGLAAAAGAGVAIERAEL